MARLKIKPSRRGIQEAALLSPEVRAEIDSLAERIAASADADPNVARHAAGPTGLRAEVRSYTTDRAAASVTLAGPDGIGVNAKYGVLPRAAFSVGLPTKKR